MRETIVFGGGIENLVHSAKENGRRDCEAKKASEQRWPNHVEAQPPNQQRRENEQISEEPVCQDSDIGYVLAKRFPSFSDGFGVESFAGHFFQSGFAFLRREFSKFFQLLGYVAGISGGTDFQQEFAVDSDFFANGLDFTDVVEFEKFRRLCWPRTGIDARSDVSQNGIRRDRKRILISDQNRSERRKRVGENESARLISHERRWMSSSPSSAKPGQKSD